MARKRKPLWVVSDVAEPSLGVDPGLDSGAAVWRTGDTVTAALCWLRLKRKSGDVWRVRSACKHRSDEYEWPTMAACLTVLPSYLPPIEHATIENQYIPPAVRGKRKVNQRDVMKVAHSAGVAWLAFAPTLDPLWALGSEWRSPYGLADLPAAEAEVSAWRIAYETLCWPGALGPWLDNITTTEAGAVGEAALMAAVRRIE